MRFFLRNLTKIAGFIFIVVIVCLAFPRLSAAVFPAMPEPSANFDCDDGTLLMFEHFQSLGIESTPIIGNLKMTGEEYMESNHVWLLVKSGDREIAYDWGTPRFDRQHYEGYTITLDSLLSAIEQDERGSSALAATSQ
jgi:hypothetical protein